VGYQACRLLPNTAEKRAIPATTPAAPSRPGHRLGSGLPSDSSTNAAANAPAATRTAIVPSSGVHDQSISVVYPEYAVQVEHQVPSA
jgi:hypothetical protein